MLHFCITRPADIHYGPSVTKESPLSTQNSTPLGFTWNVSVLPLVTPGTTHRALAIYRQKLAEFVWDAAKLENIPLTFVEVLTLRDGVTVEGREQYDVDEVLSLLKSSKKLLELVNTERFDLDYLIPSKAPELNRVYSEGVAFIKTLPPYEGALVMFLFGALQQFFFDGNKCTSRHMMNGWLMKHGFDPISVPAARAQEFNGNMVSFYVSKEGTDMLSFLNSCRRT